MALLSEKTVSGTTYVRPRKITITNDFDGSPTLEYELERVVTVGTKSTTFDMPSQTITLDPDTVTPLRLPSTGELTGQSITRSQLLIVLYSLIYQDFVEDE